MAGLQRSVTSFRRQGSSGLVWDDKLVSGELVKLADKNKEESSDQPQKEDSAAGGVRTPSPVAGLTIDRSRSNGGRGFRTGRFSPAIEPPSPKVSACGCCGAFGKSRKTRRRPPKSVGWSKPINTVMLLKPFSRSCSERKWWTSKC